MIERRWTASEEACYGMECWEKVSGYEDIKREIYKRRDTNLKKKKLSTSSEPVILRKMNHKNTKKYTKYTQNAKKVNLLHTCTTQWDKARMKKHAQEWRVLRIKNNFLTPTTYERRKKIAGKSYGRLLGVILQIDWLVRVRETFNMPHRKYDGITRTSSVTWRQSCRNRRRLPGQDEWVAKKEHRCPRW